MRILHATIAITVALLTLVNAPASGQKQNKQPKQPPRSVSPLKKFNIPGVSRRLPKANRALRTVSTQAATEFKPTGQRLLVPDLLKKMQASQEEKTAMAARLEETFAAYEGQAKGLDMENDVAGALSFFFSTHYQVYHGGTPISDAARRAVFYQFQAALDTDQIRALSDEEKQQAYETLIVSSAQTLFEYKDAVETKDREAIRGARRLAGRALGEMVKAEPTQVALSDEGFSINKPADKPRRVGQTFEAGSGWNRTPLRMLTVVTREPLPRSGPSLPLSFSCRVF